MYLSSEKMGAKASPPCLLLLPYHAACSSCICSSEGWMGSCLHWDCSPRLGVALPPAVVQLSRAGCPGLLCCHRCICHHSRTGSSCASLVLSLSHWGEKHKKQQRKSRWFAARNGKLGVLSTTCPGMEMSGKAADQKCWSSCGCGEGAQQSAQVFVCSHTDR